MWYVYLLECKDGSLYCGITNDLEKRIAAHEAGKGARYTRGRGPLKLLAYWHWTTKSDALKEEARIKKLSRLKKLEMINKSIM